MSLIFNDLKLKRLSKFNYAVVANGNGEDCSYDNMKCSLSDTLTVIIIILSYTNPTNKYIIHYRLLIIYFI